MYAADVAGQSLKFFVSGKLWQRSLIMQDQETGTEWSHILGQAQQGPLQGKTLTTIPSQLTSWQLWRTQHPETSVVVLDRTASDFDLEIYASLNRYGIGVATDSHTRFWAFRWLQNHPVVNDQLGQRTIFVYYDKDNATAAPWWADIADESQSTSRKTLTFTQREDGQLVDEQTKSVWQPLSGRAIEGPLAGQQLEPVPAIISFRDAWERFHPTSTYWHPE